MMNKFKTYAFWLALSSAVVILVQSVGKLFGFEVESSTIENVIMSICGVLVVLGIVTKKSDNTEESKGSVNKEIVEQDCVIDSKPNSDNSISDEVNFNEINDAVPNISEKRDME